MDLSNKIPKEYQEKIFNLSSLVIFSLRQAQEEIDDFAELKEQNDFYKKKNVAIALGNYYKESKFTDKNVARYLKELDGDMREDGYFYTRLNKTTEDIDYRRKEVDMGL